MISEEKITFNIQYFKFLPLSMLLILQFGRKKYIANENVKYQSLLLCSEEKKIGKIFLLNNYIFQFILFLFKSLGPNSRKNPSPTLSLYPLGLSL